MAYTTIDDPSEYFQTAIYTGTGSSQTVTNDGNSDLQPDFVWIKCRSVSRDHVLLDSTRGGTKALTSNTTGAEATDGAITAFNTDGFTHSGQNAYGGNGETHVGWQWKANGGTTSSNTDGSITSTVQANTTAGFSIVTYTGTGSAATVGHGLGVAPSAIIGRSRTNAGFNWGVWHKSLQSQYGDNAWIKINTTDAYTTQYDVFNPENNTTSVIGLGSEATMNYSGANCVAYCFAEIEGYSKFGSYTGNGNTDGPFIYTGFKPTFLLVKNSSNGGEWGMFDSARNTFNVVNARLSADTSGTEYSGDSNRDFDFLSNGIKVRNGSAQVFNTSGQTHIYMAFAENPFVSSEGVPVTAR